MVSILFSACAENSAKLFLQSESCRKNLRQLLLFCFLAEQSTVFSEFQAIEELLAECFEPPCDIYLATAVDEEISGDGAPKLVNYLKEKGVHLDVAMDEGGAILKDQLPTMKGWCAAIGLLEKGYIDLKVIAKGKGGHSSTPKSNTPLARLSKFVADIEKDKPFKAEISGAVYAMLDEAAPYLDGQYAAFGKVIEGMDVVDRIARANRNFADKPIQPQRMAKVTVKTFDVEYHEPKKA